MNELKVRSNNSIAVQDLTLENRLDIIGVDAQSRWL